MLNLYEPKNEDGLFVGEIAYHYDSDIQQSGFLSTKVFRKITGQRMLYF